MVRKWSSKSETSLKSKLSIYDTVLLDPYGHGHEQTLLGSPFSCMQNVLSSANSVVQCSSSIGIVGNPHPNMNPHHQKVQVLYHQNYVKCPCVAGRCHVLGHYWRTGDDVLTWVGMTVYWSEVDQQVDVVWKRTGWNDACSKPDTWYTQRVFHKGVGKSSFEPLS